MRKLISFLLCLVPPGVVAQTPSKVGGPVSGIVFDRAAGSLRPMVGVPGASYLGDALLSGLESAAVSPDGDMALAVSEGRLVLVTGLKSGIPATAVLSAIAGDRFAWSPDGSTAAVYSSRAAQAQVLRALRTDPAAGASIDVAGPVSSMAVSDGGDLAAGLESGIALLATGSAPRMIAAIPGSSAMAVRGRDLFAAGNGQIWQIGNFAESASAAVFADDAGTVVGLQISGKRLFAADSAKRVVTGYDLASRAAVAQVPVECALSELRAFGSQDLWLLNSDTFGADPLYVAAGSGEPAAYFVPAGRVQ